jgi:predicted NAD/FAD-binding protein
MPGRVSVDEAVKAIRIGLAAGKMHIAFPDRFGFLRLLSGCLLSSAHAVAQDGAFMNIAIIGSGIAGLTCAWRLAGHHQVTLFEAGATPGGHTATVDVATPQGTYAIDTGFIVYNDRTYPRFMGLLSELGISGQKTQMSFSVHNPAGLEYNGHSLTSLFAQRRNL